MEINFQTLSQRLILTAAMPYDDLKAIERLVDQSSQFKGLALLPSFVKTAKSLLSESPSPNLIGLVGYPSGGVSTKTKVNEVRDLVYEQVDEFHVVANTGLILSGDWDDIQCELLSLTHAAGLKPVSLIMEASYISDHQIMRLINLCVDVGIKGIGTSTGWLPMNPDIDHVRRIQEMVYGRLPIMVAGAVNLDEVAQYLESGVDSIIIRQQHAEAILAQLT